MSDARVPIMMTKDEMSGGRKLAIYEQRKLEAVHALFDMIETNKIPRGGDRWSEATYWGTLADLFPDNTEQFPNKKIERRTNGEIRTETEN
jgi:hypothetical protein